MTQGSEIVHQDKYVPCFCSLHMYQLPWDGHTSPQTTCFPSSNVVLKSRAFLIFLTGDVPTLRELQCLKGKDGKTKVKVIDTVAAIWTKVANLLDINSSIIDQLEYDYRRVADACEGMFKRRLEDDEFPEPLTWNIVIEVLKDCELNVCAEQLQTLLTEGATCI